MMKIGLLGAGKNGQLHLRALLQNSEIMVSGLYDSDVKGAKIIAEKFQVPAFDSYHELIRQSDIIDIVSPAISHTYAASVAIKNSKHVFLEQPLGSRPDELASLMKLSEEANVQVHVGFSDRFNPAFQTALKHIEHPMYVELKRSLSATRATDVPPVINDIIPGDIDLVSAIIKANIKGVEATALNIFGDNPDLLNARLAFDNGAVANITTSRIATGNSHEIRVYQTGSRLQIDLLNQKIYSLDNSRNELEKTVNVKTLTDHDLAKISAALANFIHAINYQQGVYASLSDAFHAMKITSAINDKIHLVKTIV